YAAALSFGQDPRWRRFLVSRVAAASSDTVLDVATGTGAVARELLRQKGCRVVGLDQSPEMLAEARRRLPENVELVEGTAEQLPFPDAAFDALTFTYLLRYVDDPAATLRELARVVRPGGTIAGLEFALPRGVWRPLWESYVRAGLPLAGRLLSPGWPRSEASSGSRCSHSSSGWGWARMPSTSSTDGRCRRGSGRRRSARSRSFLLRRRPRSASSRPSTRACGSSCSSPQERSSPSSTTSSSS